MNGLIFNLQRYSVADGPGIRTTVFLKGCPLRCAWCHNPEGISPRREIMLVETLCAGCGGCARACPIHVPAGSGGDRGEPPSPTPGLTPNPAECRLCGACVETCPTGARRMIGKEASVDEVTGMLLRDRLFFEESGGGVTFSGGEPLMQPTFLKELLQACRAHNLKTAVDTCGLAAPADLLEVAKLTDLFLYDLKLMDEAAHERYTGSSNRLILRNLKALGQVHEQIWVRIPVIPGVNDAPSQLEAAARFVATIPGVRRVSLLPFHRTGAEKLARLGRPSQPLPFESPRSESLQANAGIFERAGLITSIGA